MLPRLARELSAYRATMSRGAGQPHAHQPDYSLWATVGVLVVFGLVMLSSAGAVLGFQRFGDANFFVKNQLVSAVIGFGLLLVMIRIVSELSPECN